MTSHPRRTRASRNFKTFFAGPANPQKSVEKLKTVIEALKGDGATKIGVYGYCWGGKVTILGGSADLPISAIAAIHPAMLSADDAKDLQVPLGLFPSNDEPKEEYEKILEIVSKKPFADKNAHKWYTNMFHGWAAARADLNNEENKKAYEDVYMQLTNFFKKAL